MEKLCKSHGLHANWAVDNTGYVRCKTCASERVVAWRRRTKATLVAEAGGECVRCGYSKCLRSLHFHHTDPAFKKFGIAAKGWTRSIDVLRDEVSKCELLCSNCHGEIEEAVNQE